MSILDETIAQLSKAGEEVRKAIDLSERTKCELTLLTVADLKRMKLSPSDIQRIPTVQPLGRSKPKYQAADVQRYIDSRKTKPTA